VDGSLGGLCTAAVVVFVGRPGLVAAAVAAAALMLSEFSNVAVSTFKIMRDTAVVGATRVGGADRETLNPPIDGYKLYKSTLLAVYDDATAAMLRLSAVPRRVARLLTTLPMQTSPSSIGEFAIKFTLSLRTCKP
jgi:hypothetical protein